MPVDLPILVKHHEPSGCMDPLWPYLKLVLAFVGGFLLGYACKMSGMI